MNKNTEDARKYIIINTAGALISFLGGVLTGGSLAKGDFVQLILSIVIGVSGLLIVGFSSIQE